jgi:hypothetical protein
MLKKDLDTADIVRDGLLIVYIESSCSAILTLLYSHCQTRYFQHNKTLSDLPPPAPVRLRAIRRNLACNTT